MARRELDDREIPIIVRNQGIRLGAAAIGKTLTTVGAATVAYGSSVYRKPSTTRTDLFITKKAAKGKSTPAEWKTAKQKYRFMPSNDRAQQRWVEKSVRRKGVHTDSPKARGRTIMRTGTTMIGVGRAIPTMAVGWIVADASMRALEGEPIQEQGWGELATTLHVNFVNETAANLQTTYMAATIGYSIGKTVLETFL